MILSQKNSGKSRDQVIQNAFTKYLRKAITNHKRQYEKRLNEFQAHVLLFEPGALDEIEFAAHDSDDIIADLKINDVDRLMERLISQDPLLAAVLKLSERDKWLLCMRAFMELSYATIARKLGMTEDAAKMAYVRALRRARENMGVDWK